MPSNGRNTALPETGPLQLSARPSSPGLLSYQRDPLLLQEGDIQYYEATQATVPS